MGSELQSRSVDRRIGDLAEAQHGVVARAQLLAMGVGRRAIDHRIARGRLRPVHRGVLAVGHARLSPFGVAMAAVLAMRPGAVLSHRSAAWLWGIRPAARPRVEVTVPAYRRSRRRIQVHTAALADDEVTVENGIPTTAVSRTLLDLAAVVPSHQVARALREADNRRLTDTLGLAALVGRYPVRPGVPVVRALLADRAIGERVTRSELEDLFLEVVAGAGLPPPAMNVPLRLGSVDIEVDAIWPDVGVIVELDGRGTHETPTAFEADRARDRALMARGWRVIRMTWRQLVTERAAVAADLRRLVGAFQR